MPCFTRLESTTFEHNNDHVDEMSENFLSVSKESMDPYNRAYIIPNNATVLYLIIHSCTLSFHIVFNSFIPKGSMDSWEGIIIKGTI